MAAFAAIAAAAGVSAYKHAAGSIQLGSALIVRAEPTFLDDEGTMLATPDGSYPGPRLLAIMAGPQAAYSQRFVSAVRAIGGVNIDELSVRLIVTGNRTQGVRIIGIRAVAVRRARPLGGTVFLVPSQAGTPAIDMMLDFDQPDPLARHIIGQKSGSDPDRAINEYVEGPRPGGLYFDDDSIPLARGAQKVIVIRAQATKYFTSFDLEIDYITGSSPAVNRTRVTNNGHPFQVTGFHPGTPPYRLLPASIPGEPQHESTRPVPVQDHRPARHQPRARPPAPLRSRPPPHHAAMTTSRPSGTRPAPSSQPSARRRRNHSRRRLPGPSSDEFIEDLVKRLAVTWICRRDDDCPGYEIQQFLGLRARVPWSRRQQCPEQHAFSGCMQGASEEGEVHSRPQFQSELGEAPLGEVSPRFDVCRVDAVQRICDLRVMGQRSLKYHVEAECLVLPQGSYFGRGDVPDGGRQLALATLDGIDDVVRVIDLVRASHSRAERPDDEVTEIASLSSPSVPVCGFGGAGVLPPVPVRLPRPEGLGHDAAPGQPGQDFFKRRPLPGVGWLARVSR